jgi:hypothetical protein
MKTSSLAITEKLESILVDNYISKIKLVYLLERIGDNSEYWFIGTEFCETTPKSKVSVKEDTLTITARSAIFQRTQPFVKVQPLSSDIFKDNY